MVRDCYSTAYGAIFKNNLLKNTYILTQIFLFRNSDAS